MAAAVVEAPPTPAAASGDQVKPYTIRVSSRYLDLTRQKLEITRLPHENPDSRSEWWQPKPQVEPLIDFWLEQYSWRHQEEQLNKLPQFRTAFTVPGVETAIRIHFVHVRSPHSNAIPLLLIPPFPLTSLSFGHIIKVFTEPEDVATTQAFHLVVPSLPGLGFSDALPNDASVISATGEILNSLMIRLDYSHYLVTNAGSGSASPAEIDWKLTNYLATQHCDSCLGTHFISPPLARPRFKDTPVEWAKWSIAKFFHASILGYHKEDFSALGRTRAAKTSKRSPTPAQFGLNRLGLREPNTLAYALCDSPTGLLVFVLKGLRLLGPRRVFEPVEVINFTQLAWLPGPESAMRFWAHCAQYPEKERIAKKGRPRVAITVFLGDDESTVSQEQAGETENQDNAKTKAYDGYFCPSWANTNYQVVYAHRAAGKCGLLAWERPELIANGVRGLAEEVLRLDSRLKQVISRTDTVPLQEVVTGTDGATGAPSWNESQAVTAPPPADVTLQPSTPTTSTETGAASPPELKKDDKGLLAPIPEERNHSHPHPQRTISDETRVASESEVSEKVKRDLSDSTLNVASPPADTKHVETPVEAE